MEKNNRKRTGRNANGAGSITQRKDGLWMGRVTTGYNEDGKSKRQTFYGKTQKEVMDKITKVNFEMNTGVYVSPSNTTLAEWLNTWLWDYMKMSLSASTFTSYELNIRKHINPHIGNFKLKDLRTDHIQRLYNNLTQKGNSKTGMGLSPKTIRHVHNVLHQALEQAIKVGMIPKNVTEATNLPKYKKAEMRVLTMEEQLLFLKSIKGDRLEAAYRLDLATGLREGELLGLKWCDVDLEEGIIRIKQTLYRVYDYDENAKTKTKVVFQEPKTKAGKRTVPIPFPLIEDLKQHKERQEYEKAMLGYENYNEHNLVFVNIKGGPVDARGFIKKFHAAIEKAGLDHTNVHAMRHTFATRLLEIDEHPKVVQELLGHANISMTLDTYSHVLPDKKKASVQKLNSLFESEPECPEPEPEIEDVGTDNNTEQNSGIIQFVSRRR